MKWRGTPNEPMPRATSRCHRDQLVERLEALHTSIPNAGEPMAKAPFNHSQSAPAIEPPIDRRCARAAEHLLGGSHQLPGIRASGTRPRRCLHLRCSNRWSRSCLSDRSASAHSHRSIRALAIWKSGGQDFSGKNPRPLFMNVGPLSGPPVRR